ncbi:D-alanyl-D-alanine carboxypeptidase family protein [Limosilactobacillus difficilis]|uniref:D-alanyl-D-alanine carboxypeptidase family protein n=1 Tax=Limosilactobacillus difficilis TaxID=2991838 RepID=UPI0024B9E6A2|nr:D-alanyl-D-alanine carboxypeptidase family protein [Limosilactobacillus difficilis]
MRKGLQKFFTVITTVVMVAAGFSFAGSVSANAASTDTQVDAKAAIAVDRSTGQIIYQKNANQRRAIASMSKLLTVAVIEQEIHDGKLKWSTKVKVTQPIAKLSQKKDFSNVPLAAGHKYTVKQLTDAALIQSANGAALALAQARGETTAQFNNKMQKTARQMGVRDAKIYNACGLTNGQIGTIGLKGQKKSLENEMSAKDVAKVAAGLISKYPSVLKITKITSEKFPTTKQKTTQMKTFNKMLPGQSQAPKSVKINGLKTGTSDKAGACFVSTGNYGGHQLITVVMHANGGGDARFTQTANLYKNVFTNYKPVILTKVSTLPTSVASVVVPDGKNQTATNLAVAKPTTIWMKNSQQISQWTTSLDLKASRSTKHGGLIAPVKKGETVGTVNYSMSGFECLDGSSSVKVPVAAQTSVARANWFVRTWRAIHRH